MNKLTIDDLDLNGRRVLVRVDFNVPLDEGGRVRDPTRILAALPTIRRILDSGGSAVLMSHLGRPKGKRDMSFSLSPVADALEDELGRSVKFTDDCIGQEAEAAAGSLQPGDVLLLENLRFHPEEEADDPGFAEALARLGDLYVNDAFGTAHRAHASTHALAHSFPGKAAAGCLMEKELRYLGAALADPERPFVAIIGGAKISTKIEVLRRLLRLVDSLLIGGGMTYTLVKARGGRIGDSLCEEDKLSVAGEILSLPEADRLRLPIDSVAAQDPEAAAETRVFPSDDIPDGWRGLDIGPVARGEFVAAVSEARTVLWNGPVGLFERSPFDVGTRDVAEAMAELTRRGGVTIVGGGDSVAALNIFGLADRMSHVSTGGGASLEFLEGKPLPGVEALTDREEGQ